MLSNAYFLAKFGFDTAENEPAKNLQNFANFAVREDGCAGCSRALACRQVCGYDFTNFELISRFQ